MKQADNYDKVCSLIILTTLIFSLLSSLDCEFVKVKIASKIAFGPFSIISSDTWYESDFSTKGVGVGLWSFESPVGNQCFSYTYAQSLPGGVTGTISSYKKWFLNDDLTWSLARTCALTSCVMGLIANVFAWKLLLIGHVSANKNEPSRILKHRQRNLLMIMLGFVLGATVLESVKFGTFLSTDVCQRSVWLTTTTTATKTTSATQKPDNNIRVLKLSPSSNRDRISLNNDENDSQPKRILNGGTNPSSKEDHHSELQKTSATECTFARGAITSIMSIFMNLMLLFMLAAKVFIIMDTPPNNAHRFIDESGSASLISHNETVKWSLGTKSLRKSRWPRKNQLVDEGSSNGWTIGTSFRTKECTNDDELWTLGSKSNLNHNTISTKIPTSPEIIQSKRNVPRRQSFISDATGKVRNTDNYRSGRDAIHPISASRQHNIPIEPQGHKSERNLNHHVDRDAPIDDGTVMRVVPNIFVSCDRRKSGDIPNNEPSSSQQDTTHEIPKVVYSAGSDNGSETPKGKTKVARRNSNTGSTKPRQRHRNSHQSSPENGKAKASDPPPSDEVHLKRNNRIENEKARNPHMDWMCLKCKSNNRGSSDECWACSIPNVITTEPERRPSGDTNFVSMITNPNFGNSFND